MCGRGPGCSATRERSSLFRLLRPSRINGKGRDLLHPLPDSGNCKSVRQAVPLHCTCLFFSSLIHGPSVPATGSGSERAAPKGICLGCARPARTKTGDSVAQRSICNPRGERLFEVSSAKEWKNRRVTNRTLRYTSSEAFQHPHVVVRGVVEYGEVAAVR